LRRSEEAADVEQENPNPGRESEGVVGGPTGAAVELGIPRQTLESKMRKLGINRYRFKAS
jgi:DNA-binding NtrC family response regulator